MAGSRTFKIGMTSIEYHIAMLEGISNVKVTGWIKEGDMATLYYEEIEKEEEVGPDNEDSAGVDDFNWRDSAKCRGCNGEGPLTDSGYCSHCHQELSS